MNGEKKKKKKKERKKEHIYGVQPFRPTLIEGKPDTGFCQSGPSQELVNWYFEPSQPHSVISGLLSGEKHLLHIASRRAHVCASAVCVCVRACVRARARRVCVCVYV